MHYFLYVQVQRFYTSALQSLSNEFAGKALVVHANKWVIDATEQASARGVFRGMLLTEAKTILRDGFFVAWERESYLDAQKQWLDVCAQYSDRIETDEQHSAFVDLSDIALPLSAANRLLGELSALYSVFAGISTVKWIAKAAATWKPVAGVLTDACDPSAFIHPMPVAQLAPVPTGHKARLRFLGYRTIGEVASLPNNVLARQFGSHSLVIQQAANGGFHEPVVANYPPRSLIRRIRFDGGVSCVQEFENGLHRLACDISSALSLIDSQSRSMEFVLAPDSGPPIRLKRTFTKPIDSFVATSAALNLLAADALARLDRKIENPILWIRACLCPLEPCERHQQRFGTSTQGSSTADSALKSVRTAFGDSVIKSGADLVQPRRKAVLKAWKDATGWV